VASHLIIVAVLVVVFLPITVIAAILKLKSKTAAGGIQYQMRGALLSPAELSFLKFCKTPVVNRF
jgi:uncharacterized membrane protein